MENNKRNQESFSDASDKHQNETRNRSNEEDNDRTGAESDEGLVDLDGDGFIGNTGGFYGGTSYLGSNYGEGWNADQDRGSDNEGNFGAAGQQDSSDDREEGDDKDTGRSHTTKDDYII